MNSLNIEALKYIEQAKELYRQNNYYNIENNKVSDKNGDIIGDIKHLDAETLREIVISLIEDKEMLEMEIDALNDKLFNIRKIIERF